MQSTQLTPRLPRTSVRQTNINNCASRIPHQVQQQNQHSSQIYCNGTQPIGNQIANSKHLSSPPIQNVVQNPSTTTSQEANANVSLQQLQVFEEQERRKRYLTFSKDQASSHVKSLKDELLLNPQQPVNNNNNHDHNHSNNNNKQSKYLSSTSTSAKANQQRLKTPCDQLSQTQQQRQERLFVKSRNSQPNGLSEHSQVAELTSEPQPGTESGHTSPTLNATTKPRPLERLSKLPQHQQNIARIFPSPRNGVQHQVDSSEQSQFTRSGDEPLATKPNNCNNVAIKASFRQQPVCEAFIMTGQSMMKLSSNEDEQQTNLSHRDAASTFSVNNDKNLNKDSEISAGRHEYTTRVESSTETLTTSTTNESKPHSHELAPMLWVQQTHKQLMLQQQQHQQQQQQQQQQDQQQQQHQHQQQQQQQKQFDCGQIAQPPGSNSYQRVLVENVAHENNEQALDRPKKQQLKQSDFVDTKDVIKHTIDHTKQEVEPNCDTENCKNLQNAQMDGEQANNVAISASMQPNLSEQIDREADRESARRLAKRLYNLSGFKRSDVCHHLAKNNSFSQMVADEYLRLFDFRSTKLDAALRKFLSKLQLNGETQERERVLGQFSHRYYECNKEKFPSADTVQTLVCAIILLNTDLHGNHSDRKSSRKGGGNKRAKLSLGAWIDGLNSSLNAQRGDGQSADITGQFTASPSNISASYPMSINDANSNYTFPRHLLVDLYESIKKRPLKCGEDKCDMSTFESELDKIYSQQIGNAYSSRSNTLPTRRFAPGSNSSTIGSNSRNQMKQGLMKMNGGPDCFNDGDLSIEFKKGFLFRKRICGSQGKPTPKGRRGWRRTYAKLQDLHLILRYNYEPPEQQNPKADYGNKKQDLSNRKQEKQLLARDMKNTLRLHHSISWRSTVYKKREYVFHLRLADQSEVLLQATSETEMNLWIDTINFASACLSSPALPSAVTNSKKYHLRQRRPILPTSYTKLSYWEQLIDHEERLRKFKVELEEHIDEAPQTKMADKHVKSDFIERIAYLKQEIERYKVYCELMRKKSNSPEAIILSRHSQIASLTPSDEMVKSLPSFAPPQRLDESDDDNTDELKAHIQ